MARGRDQIVLRNVRTLFEVGTVGGLTDGELLDRFEAGPGEVAELAFAVLVERHGPMVLRACRRILRDEHDAHDAFQATFLVLARKGNSARRRDTLGPWLHGVACRVSACARSTAARRRRHEFNAAVRSDSHAPEPARDESGAAIHQEIDRLPERLRWPIVLCCLEGLTREQAALRLGWRVGTVQSRLARGRERLRERLVRRGLAPVVGTVAAALTVEAKAAMKSVPARLAEATIRCGMGLAAGRVAVGVVPAGVAPLVAGVFQAMLIRKLKAFAGATAAVAVAGVGITWAQTREEVPRGQRIGVRVEDPSADRLEKLEGKIDCLIDALQGSGRSQSSTNPEVLKGELTIAAQTLGDAKEKAEWAEKMAAKGYVSAGQVRAERLALMKAEQAVVRAKAQLDEIRSKVNAAKAKPSVPKPPAPLTVTIAKEKARGQLADLPLRHQAPDRIDLIEKRIDELAHRLDSLEKKAEDRESKGTKLFIETKPHKPATD